MHIIASKCFVQREFRLLKDVEGQNSHIKPIVSRVVVLFKANPGDFFKSVDYSIIRRLHSFACFRHLCRITCWRNVQTLYKWILSVAPVKWWKRGALKSSAVHKAMIMCVANASPVGHANLSSLWPCVWWVTSGVVLWAAHNFPQQSRNTCS